MNRVAPDFAAGFVREAGPGRGAPTVPTTRTRMPELVPPRPSPHGALNKAGRVAWAFAWLLLFRPTPRKLFAWRRLLLRLFGADVGRGAVVFPSTRIWAPWNLSIGEEACLSWGVDCYNVAPIRLGKRATVSQRAFLCAATHDIADPGMALVASPVTVGDGAWVCAEAFVGPGVTVGEGAVVGARAVAVRDVPAWTVVAGNPARHVKRRELRREPLRELRGGEGGGEETGGAS